MTLPPSPLWAALGATAPLFTVADGSGQGPAMTDHRVTGITTTAGTGMTGVTTASAEVTVAGYQAYIPDGNAAMTIDLTSYGASLLAGITGRSAAAIRDRFTGRVIAHEVTDTGTDKTGAPRLTTKITGQDWAAFILQLDKGAAVTRTDPNMWRLYRSLVTRAGIPGYSTLTAWGSRWFWPEIPPAETTLEVSTGDVVSKYMDLLGDLVRQDRAGAFTAWSHDHIAALSNAWADVNPDPLQRSQVVTPVSWTRPATIPRSIYWQQNHGAGDDTENGTGWSFSPEGNLVTRAETLNMLHIYDIFYTTGVSGYEDIMRARFYRQRNTDLRVEAVTVDVLALLRRGEAADRAQVGQLLTMNHGDPLALGYDWPSEVRGVYFAQRVAHKITRAAWTVDLELVPAHHVAGRRPSADLAGRTWDTAYIPTRHWDTPGTQWEYSP